MAEETQCPFIVANDIESVPTAAELQQTFSKGRISEKIQGLQQLIKLIVHDESFPRLMMAVLQYLVPSEDHEIKKLVLLYWEAVEKTKSDGNVCDELILACNNLRKDLLHPNEYIRGKTLRLVAKLAYRPILEPLLQAVLENLGHRFYYVRKNAIACLMSIYLSFGVEMLGDLPDKLEALLQNETDTSTKRNAFLLLFHCSQERAFEYLSNILKNDDPLIELSDLMQLLIVELVRKNCLADPSEKSKYLGIIYTFIESRSPAVLLECAHSLTALSKAPSAIKAAVQCYMKLLTGQNENNVILSILNRLEELIKAKRKQELEDNLMDLLTTLSSSSVEIRKKTFSIVLELISERNLELVIEYIKKNLRKDKNSLAYANLWVGSIEKLSELFPNQIFKELAVPLIDEYLLIDSTQEQDSNEDKDALLDNIGYEVAQIARKAIVALPELENTIVERLVSYLPDIKEVAVATSVAWIVGEHCKSSDTILSALQCLKTLIGPFPIVPVVKGNVVKEERKEEPVKKKQKTKTVVLPDGTYATQIVEEPEAARKTEEKKVEHKESFLRGFVLAQEGFFTAVLGVALAKLVIRIRDDVKSYNDWAVYALLAMCSMIKVFKSNALDGDNKSRLLSSIKVLSENNRREQELFLSCGDEMSAEADKKLLAEQEADKETQEKDEARYRVGAEELISFRQLKGTQSAIDYELDENDRETLPLEGMAEEKETANTSVYQLTGYTDPVYAEAIVENRYHTITVTLVLTNRTKSTLQNVQVETFIKEELKSSEKPQTFNLAPKQVKTIKVLYKASKTEDGSLFGYITYSSPSGNVPHVIPLDHIPLNLLNTILPKQISEKAFKKLWIDLVWENKFEFVTKGTPYNFLKSFGEKMGLMIVSPLSEFDRTSNLLAANLYGQTKFSTRFLFTLDEELLMNISLDKEAEDKLKVAIKIRSISRVIAYYKRE
eukprot:TRINITY_DN801_c0_g1_i7.p1 TRINITY_DN801_c0_g1~~TRINITY_DN801_c0_g1_i7.p1  ORF type:complete len:951 (+),score=329.19 TRINITY_DN801_c0_g1_i7:72-2924(+)